MKYVKYKSGLEHSTDNCFGGIFGSEPDTMVDIACWIHGKGEVCAASSIQVVPFSDPFCITMLPVKCFDGDFFASSFIIYAIAFILELSPPSSALHDGIRRAVRRASYIKVYGPYKAFQ